LIVTSSYKLKIGTTKVHFAVKVERGEWSSLESAYLQPYNSLASLASALGVSFFGSRGRFGKCEVGSYLSLWDGLYICGCVATDYSGGSVYIAFKQAGEDFVTTRLDSGTMYGANHNSGGTFLPDTNGIPEGKEAYAWYLRLA
jgi:hypothetical protein